MSLTFKLRDGEVVAKDYFDVRYLNFDWFVGSVRFDKDKNNEHNTYELWEDKLVYYLYLIQ